MAQLADLQVRLQKYQNAEERILLSGQSVSVGGQRFDRANLGQLQNAIQNLELRIEIIKNGCRLGSSTATFRGRK